MTPVLGKTYVIISKAGVSTALIHATGPRELRLLEEIQRLPVRIIERIPYKVLIARHS